MHLLLAGEALLALAQTARIPSEGGLSIGRLAVLVGLGLAALVLVLVAVRRPRWADAVESSTAALPALSVVTLVCSLALFLLRYLDPAASAAVYARLAPGLVFLILAGVELLLFILVSRNGISLAGVRARRGAYLLGLPVFITLLLLVGFIAMTRIGVAPDVAYWGEPGVPILGWHAVLAALVGLILLSPPLSRDSGRQGRLRVLGVAGGVWLLGFGLWMSVPVGVLQNSFYAPISPPAFVPYPYSDAGFYDYLSQSVLIGTRFVGQIPPRPLYVVFLTVLHVLFEQNYSGILAAQTAVLALLPVCLFLLGRALHSTAAGVMAALLAICRELVSLWVSSSIRVANSKMLTTDLPTTLGVVVVCLVVLGWFKQRDRLSAVLAGGSFGLLLLLRTQSAAILLPVVLLALIAQRHQVGPKRSLNTSSFLLSALLTVLPWLIHNWGMTGQIVFDDPQQMAVIYSQYSFTENLDISRFDPSSDSLTRSLLQFATQNPVYVATFVANHFFNTLIGAVLALPMIERFAGLAAPVNLYWADWNGSLTWYNLALVILYLAVIAVGIGASYRKLRWAGLLPLAFSLGYAASNGISRFSSWRYNLPADWIAYFYLSIGAAELFATLLNLLRLQTSADPARETEPQFTAGSRQRAWALAPCMAAFVLLGCLPWLAERSFAPRYDESASTVISRLEEQGITRPDIDSFLSVTGATVEGGLLLYPRFYRRDLGLASEHPWPAYAVRPFPRVGFVLLNSSALQVVLPTRDPPNLVHGADAYVLACERSDYLEVRYIALWADDVHYRSEAELTPCDEPMPQSR